MSFAMVPGMTLEQMQKVMGGRAEPPPVPVLAQEPKRARVRGKFKADVNEAWEPES